MATATPPFPGPVSATADDRGARVEFGPRTISDVGKGLALAVFNADGTLWRTLEFPSGSPLRVEPEAAIYEFKGESPCVEITTDRWTDIAPVFSTGSWLATVPEVVTKLVKLGFAVAVESGAGDAANFAADTYRAAGAEVVTGAAQLWARADIVLKVRPPLVSRLYVPRML